MRARFFVIVLWFTSVSFAGAQTSYPMITHVTPVAVERGKTIEITVEGQMNFAGVHTLLIEGKGVRAEVIPGSEGKVTPKGGTAPVVRSVKLKMTVAADAELGVREFRLASNLGISTLGQILIADVPVVLEAANNNLPATAQAIAVPCVVSGRIEALEDVDCFKFKGQAGQTITCEVFCARLEDKIHDLQKHADPMLTLFDSAGRELAASDDGIFADPLMTYTFKQDGEYILQIRDAKYDGDPRWAYALAVTDKPYVAQMFPFAFNPALKATVEPVGSAKLVQARIEFQAPEQPGIQAIQLPVGTTKTNPTACIVTTLPLIAEQEPNDTPSQANRITIPCGINGRIEKRRDLDYFAFKAIKGKAIRFEVFARRFGTILNSQLDSMLDILNAQGAIVASNDDANGKDAAIVFTPPADGEYTIRIRDLNNKGGEGFVYYLECDWAKPDFTLKCDPSKAMMGPGGRGAWYVQVARTNGFAGPVKVEVKGLPKEVTANPLIVPATMTQGLLVVSASPDATKPMGFNVEIFGIGEISSDGKAETLTRKSIAHEEIYSPGGGRARFDVHMQSIAITEPTDIIDVHVKEEKLVLKPGDEVKIDFEILRRKDYDKAVSADVILRHLGTIFGNPLPPGVTMVEGKSKTLLGAGNTGHIVLKVDATAAPIEDVPISVLAHVSINFVVKVSYSSKPILLSIRK
jgi:hypothetical protein